MSKRRSVMRARTRVRCEKCGFKTRGENHELGSHHKYGKDGKLSVKK